MFFRSDGTFDSSLTIYPKYTFTNVDSGRTLTLDTGSSGGAPIRLASANGTWSQSGRVTVINPNSELGQLISHHVIPAPPCPPPPSPEPTATSTPGGFGTKLSSATMTQSSTASADTTATAAVATPCPTQETLQAVDAQP
jgi:hypothetical protein